MEGLQRVDWDGFYAQPASAVPRLGIPFLRASLASLPLTLELPPHPTTTLHIHQSSSSISTVVWDAGLLLSDFLVHYVHHDHQSLGRVLDLGTGTGIAGILSCLLNATAVIFNDISQSKELAVNLESLSSYSICSPYRIEIFDWALVSTEFLATLGPFDHVLCADCCYDEKLHPSLLSLLERLHFHKLILCFKRRFDKAERRFLEDLCKFIEFYEYPRHFIPCVNIDLQLLDGVHLLIGYNRLWSSLRNAG